MSATKQASTRDLVLSPGRAPRCLSHTFPGFSGRWLLLEHGSVTVPGLGAHASALRLTPGS